MSALDAVEWEDCVLEPVRNPESERYLRKTMGVVPPGARYFLNSAWMTRAFTDLGLSVPLRHLSGELSGMIALIVSQDNSCRYCYAATRSTMRILGFPEARIRRLEENHLGADLSRVEIAALDFARSVSRAAPLASGPEWQPLIDLGASREAIKEIAFHAAANVYFNRTSTLPALPPDQMDLISHWYVRLLRPFFARMMRSPRIKGSTPLTAAQRQGPFAEVVNALDGLPGAPRLRGIIDEAWAAPVLEQGTKALIFAVTARGLGCAVSEAEARRLLAAAGQSPTVIDQALAHLSGPGLAPLDAAAVGLARESIWVRPAQIQRHLRELRRTVSPDQVVELIGFAALANMVCRLGIVTAIDRTH